MSRSSSDIQTWYFWCSSSIQQSTLKEIWLEISSTISIYFTKDSIFKGQEPTFKKDPWEGKDFSESFFPYLKDRGWLCLKKSWIFRNMTRRMIKYMERRLEDIVKCQILFTWWERNFCWDDLTQKSEGEQIWQGLILIDCPRICYVDVVDSEILILTLTTPLVPTYTHLFSAKVSGISSKHTAWKKIQPWECNILIRQYRLPKE